MTNFHSIVLLTILAAPAMLSAQSTYYVAPTGNNASGDGSASKPWATIEKAVGNIPDDGSTVIVRNGTYTGRVFLNRKFTNTVVIRAENSYSAKLRNSGYPALYLQRATNLEIAGFDIARNDPGTSAALGIHIAGAQSVVLRDNIIHESYNNDLLKINESARNIVVVGNVFRNQQGPAGQHIDVNGCTDVLIRNNIFFNDAAAAGLSASSTSGTNGFIVVKDSGSVQSRRTRILGNVFLNWQGGPGSAMILLGEDGKSFYETQDVVIENNLLIGNSSITLRTPFGIKGVRDAVYRNNTVTGNMPSSAFGMRMNREGSNPVNKEIAFKNNVWSDPTGTMTDFSDGMTSESTDITLQNNLYWNGGKTIPTDGDVLNFTDDPLRLVADPKLAVPSSVVLPNWQGTRFSSGATTIRSEFQRLVSAYGKPGPGSAVVGRSDATDSPAVDILDAPRDGAPDLGAVEAGAAAPGVRVVLFSSRGSGVNSQLHRVFLPSDSAAGGNVFLSSSNPSAAAVAPSVRIAPGDDSVAFSIATAEVTTPTEVTISATFGSETGRATLIVLPEEGVSQPTAGTVVRSLNLDKASVEGVASINGTVTLATPATAPGVTMTLTASSDSAVSLPGSVTIAAGATTGAFTFTSKPMAANTSVTIKAATGGSSASAVLQIKAPEPEQSPAKVYPVAIYAPATTPGGSAPNIVVMLNAEPTSATTIQLQSSRPDLLVLPASLQVPAGSNRLSFYATTAPVASGTAVGFSTSIAGVSKSATISLTPPTVLNIYAASTSISAGTSMPNNVVMLNVPAAAGAKVALTSSNPAVLSVPASVTCTAGSNRAYFTVTAGSVSRKTSVIVSATSGGVTKTVTITAQP